ncbi:MAG: hypothetical protein IPL11_09290 [Candidatus Accumulibacter sp.]|nr:hypothetical protein [Accumulibacter sp.]
MSVWLVAGVCAADVPTAAQECRLRNAATCELRGVPYVVDGPCPPGHEPSGSGNERCAEAADEGARAREIPALAQPVEASPARFESAGDLVRIGQIERWLLLAILVFGALLIAALVAVIALRRRQADRDEAAVEPGVGRTILQLLVAAALAVPLGYQAAGFAFRRIFAGFDNHDTAAPWLLAAPAGAVVFILVTGVGFALLALLLDKLLRGRSGR